MSLTIISGAICFVVVILCAIDYYQKQKGLNFKLKTVQGFARKVGLISIIAIIIEAAVMNHLSAIHFIAISNAIVLWIFGLLTPSDSAGPRTATQ